MISIFDDRQLGHAPVREFHNGGWLDYQECPDRARRILDAIGPTGELRDWGLDPILAVHDHAYIEFLKHAWKDWQAAGREGDAIGYVWPIVGRRVLSLKRIDARLGQYSYDAGTPIAEQTWESAYWSSQTALSALDAVLTGTSPTAFALCRPPGHHAGRDYMGGYCYLNNAAIAAQEAHRRGAGPVAILDIDYHHGNGTQDVFYDNGDIFFGSIHADPITDYPFYWGHADECGAEGGRGANLNLPMPRGTDARAYLPALERALAAIEAWGARMLIVSFGADTFVDDPISHFALTRRDFSEIGGQIARTGLPSLIVMEGGYATEALGANVAALLDPFR